MVEHGELEFYEVIAKQGPQFFDGEWSPFPPDLYALHTQPSDAGDLHIEVRTGVRPGDLLFATPNVVSQRLLDVLLKVNATGFEAAPVHLAKKGHILGTFYRLTVYGRGGPLDLMRSDADVSRGGVIFGLAGIYIDESRWDGSDVFLIPGLGICLFVTARVAAAMKRARLANVCLVRNCDRATGTRKSYGRTP